MNIACDKLRPLIYYNYKERLSQTEHLESLKKKFDNSCVSHATVYNWCAKFNRGRYYFEDEPRTDGSRSVVTQENIEAVHKLISVDPHIKYQQIQDTLRIGSVPIESMLHDCLGLRKVTCR